MPVSLHAATAFADSTSATASWNDAATSATGACGVRGKPSFDRGLQTRERVVVGGVARSGQAPGEGDGPRVPFRRSEVDGGSPGEPEPQHPGHFVESLTGRIVDGGTHRFHIGGHILDAQDRRVPAGGQQRHTFTWQRPVLQLVDGHVRGQVVDAVQRLVQSQGKGFGCGNSHNQRAGQTGTGGDGDRVEVAQLDPSLVQPPAQGRDHRLDMSPAGNFGDDPAEAHLFINAAGHGIGEQTVSGDDPDPSLITRRLDPQYQWTHRSNPITRASLKSG